MAHDLKKPLEVYGTQARMAYAVFTTAGSSDPTVLMSHGIRTITRSATGTILLTMKHAPIGTYYVVTVGKEFTTDAQSVVITAQSASAKTITLKTVTAASANTAVDTTGMNIHVQIMVRMAA